MGGSGVKEARGLGFERRDQMKPSTCRRAEFLTRPQIAEPGGQTRALRAMPLTSVTHAAAFLVAPWDHVVPNMGGIGAL